MDPRVTHHPRPSTRGSCYVTSARYCTYCHICEGELLHDKVADHCHLTGKFRGAAHNKCNLEYRTPKFFPVIFHNLAGYAAHLFVKNLGVTEGKINCIPKNEENYISFTKEIEVDTFTKEIEVDNKTKTISVKRELLFLLTVLNLWQQV